MPPPLEASTSHAGCLRQPGGEPIPGYRLLEPLGRGGFGEVWKCEAPGGLLKAIKFVQGRVHALDDGPAMEELRGIRRIKSVRHPFLLSIERVEVVEGELVIVLELADLNLADVRRAEQAAGRPGVARDVLLRYLGEAAEALDVIHVQHQLQHFDVKPENLFLVSDHVKVGDFGLVQSLATHEAGRGERKAPGAITPRYAAPEVFAGEIGPNADQYSLAIVYQELLTSTLPFSGKNYRQLMLQHARSAPDLRPLPEADRAAVARALAKKPRQRFPSCSDFVHALVAGQTELVVAPTTGLVPVKGPPTPVGAVDLTARTDAVAVTVATKEAGASPHFRFTTSLPTDVVRMRLDGFQKQWNGTPVQADDEGLVLQMKAPRSFWQPWKGQPPSLEVRLCVVTAHDSSSGVEDGAEVWLSVSPRDCQPGEATRLLGVLGPLLAESVRTHLQLNPRQRAEERLAWRYPMHLTPVLPDGSLGTPRECQGKDISLNGIGFYIAGAIPGSEVILQLPETELTDRVAVRARVVRAHTCSAGWHEIGAILEVPRATTPEPDAPARGRGESPQRKQGAVKSLAGAAGSEPAPASPWFTAALLGLFALVAAFAGAVGWYTRPSQAAAPVERSPHVEVVGIDEAFADLQRAIDLAPSGGVLRIHGKLRTPPVRVTGKALTIQGVAGTMPVLVRLAHDDRRWEPFVTSDSPLALEGLALCGSREDAMPLVCVHAASLSLRDCKLAARARGPAIALRRGRELRLTRCELHGTDQGAAIEVADHPCRVELHGCTAAIQDQRGALLLAWSGEDASATPLDLSLRDSRVEAGRVLACRGVVGPVRVVASGNQLALRQSRVSFAGYPDPKAAERLVTWQDD